MYNDDAFATMLLTIPLSADRTDFARTLSTAEYVRLLARVKDSTAGRLGALLQVDISGLMMILGISEAEAYRLYTLLHRGVQLMYMLQGFMERGARIITCFDDDYPDIVRARMGKMAPPAMFFAGERPLLDAPAVAVMGAKGVKTTPEVRQCIEGVVRGACERGFGIITGGDKGVAYVAESLVAEMGGTLIEVPSGGLLKRMGMQPLQGLMAEGRMAALSLEHPEALPTRSHAAARNKLLFALARAVFVFNIGDQGGEVDALKRGFCDWVYAYTGFPGNRALVSHGAQPFTRLDAEEFKRLSSRWKTAFSQQLNMFDMD